MPPSDLAVPPAATRLPPAPAFGYAPLRGGGMASFYGSDMPERASLVRIEHRLFYAPEGRNADGSEIPAVHQVTVQGFLADGRIASPVFSYLSIDRAEATVQKLWPGVPVEYADNRPALRQAYRQVGIEIPELQEDNP